MTGCPYSHRSVPLGGEDGLLSLARSFAHVMLRDPTEIIPAVGRASAKSDRTKISIATHDFHVLKHPDDIRSIFVELASACPVSHAKSSAASYKPGATKLGNSSSNPEVWKEHRRVVSHHVGPRGLNRNYEGALNATLGGISEWEALNSINVDRETTKIALRYAWAAFFTDEISDTDADVLADLGSEHLQKFFLLTFATLGKVPPGIIRKLSNVEEFTGVLDAKLERVITNRLTNPQWPNDFLSEVIVKNDLDESPFDVKKRNQAISELTEILVASYLNTRTALYWSVHTLARDPEMQQRIRRETLSGQPENGYMKAAEMTALEILRLYPPVYLLPRQTNQDITLTGDYNIAAGSHILIPTWHVHRDPRWYPDSENFNPDANFSPAANTNRAAHSYLPFGLGRHKCPGYGVAMQEITSVLSVICTAYEIQPDPLGTQPYLRAGTILNPERESTLRIAPRPGASVNDAAQLLIAA